MNFVFGVPLEELKLYQLHSMVWFVVVILFVYFLGGGVVYLFCA